MLHGINKMKLQNTYGLPPSTPTLFKKEYSINEGLAMSIDEVNELTKNNPKIRLKNLRLEISYKLNEINKIIQTEFGEIRDYNIKRREHLTRFLNIITNFSNYVFNSDIEKLKMIEKLEKNTRSIIKKDNINTINTCCIYYCIPFL